VGDEMPADPFREDMPDWGAMAANHFAFFSAHMAAGFTEAQALDLTGRYLSFMVSILFANQAAQQQPE